MNIMEVLKDYESFIKCFKQTIISHPTVSIEDIAGTINLFIVEKHDPAIGFLLDLVRRMPVVKGPKPLMPIANRSVVSRGNLPGLKLWRWWDPKLGDIPIFPQIEFWNSKKKGKINIGLVIRFGTDIYKGSIVTTTAKASNLVKYLLKKGIKFSDKS